MQVIDYGLYAMGSRPLVCVCGVVLGEEGRDGRERKETGTGGRLCF